MWSSWKLESSIIKKSKLYASLIKLSGEMPIFPPTLVLYPYLFSILLSNNAIEKLSNEKYEIYLFKIKMNFSLLS